MTALQACTQWLDRQRAAQRVYESARRMFQSIERPSEVLLLSWRLVAGQTAALEQVTGRRIAVAFHAANGDSFHIQPEVAV